MSTKRDLLVSLHKKYKLTKSRDEKSKIINSLILTVGYTRKYAIGLLNKKTIENISKAKPVKKIKYDEGVKLALIMIWNAANRICSKRLKPFLPQFIESLENHGHLVITEEVRIKLITISTGTIDFLLKDERVKLNKSINTTRSGSILKKQIKVRTFAGWDDVVPGFFEIDLVAHCGGSMEGSFLNTLTLTDIATGWTECLPLLCRSKENVIDGLKVTMEILLFEILGIDSDNGSEFINYALVKFCEANNITFTRARAYKKNDQAHVEEKNGSIVRRIVGYDRFEGVKAWQALTELYAVLRLYVNFFQPSLKLISKIRDGSKITKKYDTAKTPCQRLIDNEAIPEDVKLKLKQQSKDLDPLKLLQEIQNKQQALWKHAWDEESKNKLMAPVNEVKPSIIKANKSKDDDISVISLDKYRSTKKPSKTDVPRLYKTRQDPFEDVKDKIKLRLELDPHLTAKLIMEELVKEEPNTYNQKQLRTLQRRVADWRKQQWHKSNIEVISNVSEHNDQTKFLSLVLTGEKQQSNGHLSKLK